MSHQNNFTELCGHDTFPIVANLLKAKDIGRLAATNTAGKAVSEGNACERAKKIVSDCPRAITEGLADTFTAPLFKRNLRIINAGDRKDKLVEQSKNEAKSVVDLRDIKGKLDRIKGKLDRIDDEIFYAAEGTALSDLEVVSDFKSEKDDGEEDEPSPSPSPSGRVFLGALFFGNDESENVPIKKCTWFLM